MTMCPPCAAFWLRWLDYRLPPPPIRLCTPGASVREVKSMQEARYREWRETVRFEQDLTVRLCREGKHVPLREDER